MKPKTREVLNHIVQFLIAFGIKLTKYRTEKNTFDYKFEPYIILTSQINELVDLHPYCLERKTILDLPYAYNQLIAQTVNLLLIRLNKKN